MSDLLHYKGCLGSVEYSQEDDVLHGKLQGIGALVNYEGEDLKTLKAAFEEAVDSYLEFCKEVGETPEKPFEQAIQYQPDPIHYQRAINYAKEHDLSVKAVLDRALEEFLKKAA